MKISKTRFARITDHNGLMIGITYYGNEDSPDMPPEGKAQIMIDQGQWSTAAYLSAGMLRTLAAELCKAACAIEEGQAAFNHSKYVNDQTGEQ